MSQTLWVCDQPPGQRPSLHAPAGCCMVPSRSLLGLGLGGRSPENPRMDFQGKRLSRSQPSSPGKAVK